MAAAEGENPPVLVIGIDFGTTYSGIAWLRSGRKNQVKFVTDWKKRNLYQGDKQKVPSAIFYHYMNDENAAWGFTTPREDGNVLRWFKLLLVDEKDLPEHVRHSSQLKTARALMIKANKTPVQILGDYLQKVWKHSRETIVKAEGKRMMKISQVNVVVTLPAIWPHYVRSRMTEALGHAGLLDVTHDRETMLNFISEPEAAALTCLEENSDRPDVGVGDHFMVCDAGGGTVDIITYKVEKLHPLTVSESVKGDGGLCGAIFLDERFLELLKESIPHDIQRKLQKHGLHKIMDNDWEVGIKSEVCKASNSWPVQLPYNGVVNNNIYPPQFSINGSRSLSENKSIKSAFVILVGGFGRSPYLYECLQEAVGSKIDVLQEGGPGPWTAVLRGAVLHGQARSRLTDAITVVVDSRISRHSYGTLVNIIPFDPNEHNQKDRMWCEAQQEFLAVEQTEWFVKIGDSISAYDPQFHSYWQDLTSPGQSIQIDIVTSDTPTAPNRKDSSVKPLCVITSSELPEWNSLPVYTNKDGQVFHRVSYELGMISDGTSLDFSVYYKNKKIATGSVPFDSTNENDSDDVEAAPAETVGDDSDSDFVDDEGQESD
ncbi:hypothetical protein F53441_9967 [Fusarium austroafricanum]|uniref:Actin-like ATPase domain-containing protein n=1 Tax=Fusarium austroafricanum TaxID=2364996 RepID=A0A8H4NPR0_9HYPO|nr:hypothetical protein F53441_9967 [Fusarium austroafricanum]